MMQEGYFDLSITELQGLREGTSVKRTSQNSAHGAGDPAITKMEKDLMRMDPDDKLIRKVRRIIQSSVVVSFSARSFCRLLMESYPDDCWMMTSQKKNEKGVAKRKRDWLRDSRLEKQTFIFPIGFTDTRALRVNAMERKWGIVEFDADEEQGAMEVLLDRKYQLSLLLDIAEKFPKMPLHLVVDSRRRSYQGWFWVGGVSQSEYFDLYRYARRLGCDPHGIRPEMRCRLPGGWNRKVEERNKRQFVVWMSDEFQKRLEQQKERLCRIKLKTKQAKS